jgi:hypothetical protein
MTEGLDLDTKDFIEPREVIPLPGPVLEMLASRQHRLLHAVWHGTRGLWFRLTESQRAGIKDLGWAPPRASAQASGPIINNGAGEDFLFMHRQMIMMVNETARKAGADPIEGWLNIPPPAARVGNEDGFAIPPTWIDPADELSNRRIAALKTDEYFWSRMRWWDREFKNPQYLRSLKLGELGALLEYSVHNDMHMRWASAPRDPESAEVVASGRPAWDVSTKWDNPIYDFLGEFYSSHVNPVFWRLHGWIDDRVNDWHAAHKEVHAGEIETTTIGGVSWFKPGKWVVAADPWAGAKHQSHGGHHGMSADPAQQDIETMEKVNAILFPKPSPTLRAEAASRGLQTDQTSMKLTWF